MSRSFPTLTTGSALALAFAFAALLTSVGLAAHALSSGGSAATTASRGHAGLRISGNVKRPLSPGTSRRLNLRLSNRSRQPLVITKIRVSLRIDAAHKQAGCRRARNFRVTRLKRRQYPISLPARRTRSLRALGIRRLPRVRMLNLPTNQDACKGAKLRLRYRALVRHGRPVHAS